MDSPHHVQSLTRPVRIGIIRLQQFHARCFMFSAYSDSKRHLRKMIGIFKTILIIFFIFINKNKGLYLQFVKRYSPLFLLVTFYPNDSDRSRITDIGIFGNLLHEFIECILSKSVFIIFSAQSDSSYTNRLAFNKDPETIRCIGFFYSNRRNVMKIDKAVIILAYDQNIQALVLLTPCRSRLLYQTETFSSYRENSLPGVQKNIRLTD